MFLILSLIVAAFIVGWGLLRLIERDNGGYPHQGRKQSKSERDDWKVIVVCLLAAIVLPFIVGTIEVGLR